MSGEEPTLSKSARKRANQKARAAEAEAVAAPPPPAPEPAPKAKAKAKAEAPPAAKPKAKAQAKEQPAPAAAEPKAKAKAKAKAEPAPAPAAEPKPKAKAAASKPAAKAKAPPKEEPKKEPEKPAADPWEQWDDGKGGGWEEASGLSKKQQKQRQKKEEQAELAKQLKAAGAGKTTGPAQHVPGMPTQADVIAANKKDAKGKAASQAVAAANIAIAAVSAAAVASKDKEPVKETVVDTSVSAAVKIPDNKIGWVIGPKGATIAMIKEKTGVKTIDTSGGVATIVGDKEPVAMAEAAIHELIQKGFTSLAFDNFSEAGVQVHPSHFPNIIGEKGAIINAIKKEVKCEVGIPEVPKNSPPSKKFKITLSGANDNVQKATEIINSIVKYGHHEITHPGFVHEEVEVEEWKYKYLIGTKGSEMRHIQNSFHVKVNIPRETSEIQNVVVVGERQDVERAVKHIEKIMFNAEQPKGRGSAEQAIDPWGEDEEEAWMSPYLYKRK